MAFLAALYADRRLFEFAVGALLSALIIGGFAWHERTLGAVKCTERDAAHLAHQLDHNAQLDRSDAEVINDEIRTHAAAVAVAPVGVPVVRLCKFRLAVAALPPTDTTTGGSNDATNSREGNQGNSRGFTDSGPALVAVGRRSDAQLAMLTDYVRRVCLVNR